MNSCIHNQTIQINIGDKVQDVYSYKFFNSGDELKFVKILSIFYISPSRVYKKSMKTFILKYHNSDLKAIFIPAIDGGETEKFILISPIKANEFYEIKISFENTKVEGDCNKKADELRNGIIIVRFQFSN